MKRIRKVRTYLERHKIDQKVNSLWYLAGLATIPAIAGISGLLLKLTPAWLCGLAIVEGILIAFLSLVCAVLLDKLKLAEKYLKAQNTTWDEIESDVEFSDAFGEATEEKNKIS